MLQRLADELWAEEASADSNGDDVGELLASGTHDFPAAHSIREVSDPVKDTMHISCHILAVDGERLSLGLPESDMQN